jgi:hypothetical protein
MQHKSKDDFGSFYSTYKNVPKQEVAHAVREKKFKELMRNGTTSLIIDWSKIIYGALGVAFVIKGIRLLYR